MARRKLRQLQIAGRLEDLHVPPGNRLKALKGDRAGQHSIRVNDRFRVCFRWSAAGAEDVEIVDYHYGRYLSAAVLVVWPFQRVLAEVAEEVLAETLEKIEPWKGLGTSVGHSA